MAQTEIEIRGAREHNLRDVSVTIPRGQLVCLTGVSGSGKSSLAFDTLYAEGQRRYLESLSTFARQYLGGLPKPDVDFISGLSPSISISQKSSGVNPRSTVGTVTEIHDYLRVLFARIGHAHCPTCGQPVSAQTAEQIVGRLAALPAGREIEILAPVVKRKKGEFKDLFESLRKQGFVRARLDGSMIRLADAQTLDRQMRHDIDVVVDRLVIRNGNRNRLTEAVATALDLGEGSMLAIVVPADAPSARETALAESRGAARRNDLEDSTATTDTGSNSGSNGQPGAAFWTDAAPVEPTSQELRFSTASACATCGISFEPLSPQLFSFNSPQGMCGTCDGLGTAYNFLPELILTDVSKSVKKGALMPIGLWADVPKWKRQIYQGVADTVERLRSLPKGTLLDTPWKDLPSELQEIWLHGTAETLITVTIRGGAKPIKAGMTFTGICGELLASYRQARSKPHRLFFEKFMRPAKCPDCQGTRLNAYARSVTVTTASTRFSEHPNQAITEISALPLNRAVEFFKSLKLEKSEAIIASEVVKEIGTRLRFLLDVGLEYLSLDRPAPTLSGGESQRIRLASQIGSGLVGVTYVLDEPSIGLHPRDNERLLASLERLRDLGNTVVVVEHDEETIRAADKVIDFGPGAGVRGGDILVAGTPEDVATDQTSVTGAYLSGRRRIDVPKHRRTPREKRLNIRGIRHHNIDGLDVSIPLGVFVGITGVSGSGKSSLTTDVLMAVLHRDLNGGESEPGHFELVENLDQLDKMIAIDQSPIGRTPRSNPATYIKVFDDIRRIFTQLPDAKRRGFEPGRFSFNVAGGRCEACEGNGSTKLEMDFLADIWVPCPVCGGKRFSRETLAVRFKGHSIADVLEMDVATALDVFENVPSVRAKLQTLHDVGLDYIRLGQPSPTLSGGEAQRVKLAKELSKRSTGKTIYILDEPTTGLHFSDVDLLLKVLHSFVEAGNTVVVVEHNLDVIKTCDYLIDMGPEGGDGGGRIVAEGTPEQVAKVKASYTGRAIKAQLTAERERDAWYRTGEFAADTQTLAGEGLVASATLAGPPRTGARSKSRARTAGRQAASRNGQTPGQSTFDDRDLIVTGAAEHNLRGVSVRIPRETMTVCCGPSGSGKTSLAMDTIYAEGQRRYVESLSSYARQFVSQLQKPKFENIEGLSPAVALEQKNLSGSPRSTVGTVTEIYDYLRVLYARLATMHCPSCGQVVGTQTLDQIVEHLTSGDKGTRLMIAAPMEVAVGESYDTLWDELRADGFLRVRIDGSTHTLDDVPTIDRRKKHTVQVIVDRLTVDPAARSRMAEAVENALTLGRGVMHVITPRDDVAEAKWPVEPISQHLVCHACQRSFEPLTPHHFSFNSPLGWCGSCEGIGTQQGTSAAAFLNEGKSLAEGAVTLWPNLAEPMAQAMLTGLAQAAGLDLQAPFATLPAAQRRTILYGTGDEWIQAPLAAGGSFSFQYKGIYPALADAARLSAAFRVRLAQFVGTVDCPSCDGSRLRDDAAAARFRGDTIDDLTRLPLNQFAERIGAWHLDEHESRIAGELVREVLSRARFLLDVGLEYLTLGRVAGTLSGGEAQRIRLASQLGSGLCGVLYVLDEPTTGLHPRDNRRLLGALGKLRDLGNTLLLVEHDAEIIAESDYVLDFGPGAGHLGGEVVADGTPAQLLKRKKSVTAPYLGGSSTLPVPTNRREVLESTPAITVVGAMHNNLKDLTCAFPLGRLTVVTGPSGCGKSSLVNDVLTSALLQRLHRAQTTPGTHREIRGVEQIDKIIQVDQSPLGNTPSSNAATYTGVFDLIRELFSHLPEARARGYSPRRFSFNAPGGRCERCEGNGQIKIEMHFLPDVWIECEDCRGQRYKLEILDVRYHGKHIADVLTMTVHEATSLFSEFPKIHRTLQTLCDVGLSYVPLGQSATTLSGGEAQRVKLARELARPQTGKTLYVLDEPTVGLHFSDVEKLLGVLQRLVDVGNSVIVIEHNLDVIKSADWVIEIGPEAGIDGGQVVFVGTPEGLAEHAAAERSEAQHRQAASAVQSEEEQSSNSEKRLRSHTGEALRPVLAASPQRPRPTFATPKALTRNDDFKKLAALQAVPWEEDGYAWHTGRSVDRLGKKPNWERAILIRVIDYLEKKSDWGDTDYNHQTTVSGRAIGQKTDWFFHAITSDPWAVTLKFRTARGAFDEKILRKNLPLKPFSQLDGIDNYSNTKRVKVRRITSTIDEVVIAPYQLAEIDRPAFWSMLDQAWASYLTTLEARPDGQLANLEQNVPSKLPASAPWDRLRESWHGSDVGFPPGQPRRWSVSDLRTILSHLESVSERNDASQPDRIAYFFPGETTPWAEVLTRRADAIVCRFALADQPESDSDFEAIEDDPSSPTRRWGILPISVLDTPTETRLIDMLAQRIND